MTVALGAACAVVAVPVATPERRSAQCAADALRIIGTLIMDVARTIHACRCAPCSLPVFADLQACV
jgi:hypothetical protein